MAVTLMLMYNFLTYLIFACLCKTSMHFIILCRLHEQEIVCGILSFRVD